MQSLHSTQIAWCIFAQLLAFFLPGYFFSKYLRSSAPVLSAFLLSVMVLFQGFFWLEVLGVPLRFATMMSWEILWTVIGALAWISIRPRAKLELRTPTSELATPPLPSTGVPGEGADRWKIFFWRWP